jgi:hypothetical protein
VRRAQLILLSAEQHLKAAAIGQQLGLSDQGVRQVRHAFNARGVASLEPGRRARHDDQRALNAAVRAQLRDLIRQAPREHGDDTSLWTLSLLADLCFQKGWTASGVGRNIGSIVRTPTPAEKKVPGLVENQGGGTRRLAAV